MTVPSYFVIELKEDFAAAHNSQVYKTGCRALVWEDTDIKGYWTVNTNDIISCASAKKIYSLDLKEIKDEHIAEPQQNKDVVDGVGFLLTLIDGFCKKCGTNAAGDCDSFCPNYKICNKEKWDKVRSNLNIPKQITEND